LYILEWKPHDKIWTEKDAERNLETQPPEGEQVILQGLWAVEYYTPSHTDRLFDGFNKLGWDEVSALNTESATNWVREQRNSMLGGGWFNLGYIKSVPKRSVLRMDRVAPLPESVEYAMGSILTLTSSLTCVAMFFVYKEPRLSSLQSILMSPKKTVFTPSKKGGYLINGPEEQKRAEVEAIRKLCREEAWLWFRSNLPGVFTSERKPPKEFPTCELLTTKSAEAFMPRSERKELPPRFLSILEVDYGFDAWAAHSLPALRIGTYLRKPKSHLIASVRFDHLAPTTQRTQTRISAMDHANELMASFMTRWGLVALFLFLQRRVNLLRDGIRRYANFRSPTLQSFSTLADLELRSLDAMTVAKDTRHFADQWWFPRHVTDFRPVQPHQGKGDSFVQLLRTQLTEQADWLATADEQVRRAVAQQTNLLATRTNIRLQTWMMVLAVVGVVLTLASIVTATNSGRAHLEPIVARLLAWDPYN
jgi:hypothetical protein